MADPQQVMERLRTALEDYPEGQRTIASHPIAQRIITSTGRRLIPCPVDVLDDAPTALSEAQEREKREQTIHERELDDARAERDAYRRNASLAERRRAEKAEAELSRLRVENEELKARPTSVGVDWAKGESWSVDFSKCQTCGEFMGHGHECKSSGTLKGTP